VTVAAEAAIRIARGFGVEGGGRAESIEVAEEKMAEKKEPEGQLAESFS